MDSGSRHQPSTGTEFGAPQEFKPYGSTPSPSDLSGESTSGQNHVGMSKSHGHSWMHWLMCLPMVAIVGFLVLTGAAGGGAILYALGCMAMMGVMMLFMNHGTQNSGHHH